MPPGLTCRGHRLGYVFDPGGHMPGEVFRAEILCQLQQGHSFAVRVHGDRNDDVASLVKMLDVHVDTVGCVCRHHAACVWVISETRDGAREALRALHAFRQRRPETRDLRIGLGRCNFQPLFPHAEAEWSHVDAIDDDAFRNQQSRTNVNLTNMKALTSVGAYAFFNTLGVPDLTGLSLLESIGDYAFYHTERTPKLSDLVSLKRIGVAAFAHCRGVPDLLGLRSLTTIDREAFFTSSGVDNLSSLAELRVVGDEAFCNAVHVPDLSGLQRLEVIGMRAFSSAERGRDASLLIRLPELVTVGAGAFQGYTGDALALALPKLLKIGTDAFSSYRGELACLDLPLLSHIGEDAFASATRVNLARLPSLVQIDKGAFQRVMWMPSFPESLSRLSEIGSHAFKHAQGEPDLRSLSNLEVIGEFAFYKAQGQPNLSGLKKLRHIGRYAFKNARRLPILSDVPMLESIGKGAFECGAVKPGSEMPDLSHERLTVGAGAFKKALGGESCDRS
jgi:hypothetical protein